MRFFHDSSLWSDQKSKKKEQWREYLDNLVQKPHWIIDGNYMCTLELRIAAAETIIFLDYPRWLCLWRILRRNLVATFSGKKIAGGNPGKVEWSFLKFVWSYKNVERPKVIALLESYGEGRDDILFLARNR
jgi:adenylate kinase family enzyme